MLLITQLYKVADTYMDISLSIYIYMYAFMYICICIYIYVDGTYSYETRVQLYICILHADMIRWRKSKSFNYINPIQGRVLRIRFELGGGKNALP